MIRKAKKSDIPLLAQIHYDELRSDFLPSLGKKFLETLLLSFYHQDCGFFVAQQGEQILGFVIGSKDFKKDFRNILRNNAVKFAVIVLPEIFKQPSIVLKLAETFFYTEKYKGEIPSSELVVIAITKKYHRQGMGRILIQYIEKYFMESKKTSYKVTVNSSNKNANMFYTSLGFRKITKFNIYGKLLNLYTKELI